MRTLIVFLLTAFIWSATICNAQTPSVTLRYQNKLLKDVLSDLERQHKLSFSYANGKLELDKKVNAYVQAKNIDQALMDLFRQNNISYSQIGGQWVLKNGPQPTYNAPAGNLSATPPKIPSNTAPSQQNTDKKPETTLAPALVEVKKEEEKPAPPRELPNKSIEAVTVAKIETTTERNNALEKSLLQRLRADVNHVFESWKERRESGEIKVFQLSTIGTRKTQANKTNILSFSLTWGQHGSSEGLQAAIMGSVVRRDAMGFQFSGMFNSVGKRMMGLQIAGMFNATRGDLYGLQIAGVFNRAQRVMGGQLSLGLNWSQDKLMGMQLGAVGNVAMRSANSAQIASIFNYTKEKSNFQLSGAYNFAGDVEGAQITAGVNESSTVKGLQLGAVNRAKVVRGAQIGLINFADTVRGVSIGLLNIVQQGGYNKLECSFSESVHVLFTLKMGARSLYHIYQGGFNLQGSSWGIGWGLGSVFKINRRWNLNVEGAVMHINEDKKWNSVLNMLSQAKAGFEYNLDADAGFSIFVGPTVNFMLSRYRNPETGVLGSSVPMYALWDHTNRAGTNLQMWVGAQTGIRMRLW